MNATTTTRGFSTVLDEVALACTRVLLACCILDVALPRAGRAAAALLLRTDSGILRWIESTGARVEVFAENGILFSALATIVLVVACRIRQASPAGRVALGGILMSGVWVFARRSGAGSPDVWWPAAAVPAFAGAAIVFKDRSLAATFAALLLGGVAAYAAWALIVSSGSAAEPRLDKASEALILAGIAGAGIASALSGSRMRLVLAALTFAGTWGVAVMFREASHAIVRHLVTVGNSGLSFQLTAPLLAAAVAGLILATGRPGLFAPLVVALVCARRPEPYLILGTLASAALLVTADLMVKRTAS